MKWTKEEKTPLSPLNCSIDVLILCVCIEPGAGLHAGPAMAQAFLVARCWLSLAQKSQILMLSLLQKFICFLSLWVFPFYEASVIITGNLS